MSLLARSRKRFVRQGDIVEWLTTNKPTLRQIAKKNYAAETGILGYCMQGIEFIGEMTGRSKKPEKELSVEDKKKQQEEAASTPMAQYYQSEELLKAMKWKRVTWDKDANYDAFARRLIDTDKIFSGVPAFSYLSIHVVHDKAVQSEAKHSREVREIRQGVLTDWCFSERTPATVATAGGGAAGSGSREPPYVIDWVAGEVRMLDSASPQEVATFLKTTAARIMAVQVRMDEEQTKFVEDLETTRIRLGVMSIKLNAHDRAFWDDAKRKTDPTYVNPDHLRMFLDSALKRAMLLRFYLKGTHLRIVRPGDPFSLDVEKREVRIPANFEDYNFLTLHRRWANIEWALNGMRAMGMLWFFIGMMLVGDFELL